MKKIFFLLFCVTAVNSGVLAQNSEIPQALKGYIGIALSQNPDVQASRARWKGSDAKVGEASSYVYPHVDLSWQFSGFSGGRVITVPGFGSVNTAALGIPPWDNKLQASWAIGNYGAWEGIGAAKSFREAATSEVDASEQQIALQVGEAYYNYAKAAALTEVKKSVLALAEENLKFSTALYNAEKAAKNEVLRAEVNLAAAQGDVITAERFQIITQTAFNMLLNRKNDAQIILPSEPEMGKLQKFIEDVSADPNVAEQKMALPALDVDADTAILKRSEIKQLQSTQEALEGVKEVNKSDYYPNVSIFGSYGWQEQDLKFATNSDLLIGGVLLKWNLFTGFGTKAKVEEAEAQVEEIRYQRQAAANGIRLELENARSEKVSSIERLIISKKAVASAEENYRITKAQYDNGTTQFINLIDAQNALNNSKSAFATATYDLLIAETKYKHALGMRLQ
jgi:outer membrane protein TolC